MPRFTSVFRAYIILLCIPMVARAKLCGDHVDGRDVPCACGDTVVSDLVLTDDPVTTTVCSGDGLVVRAGGTLPGVTIDLGGKTLRGSGHGRGIWVVYGGTGGASIVSRPGRGRVDGFMDGIVGNGADAVFLIDHVLVSHSKRDGIRLNAPGYTVHDTQAESSGRDGFGLGGRSFQISGGAAVNSGRYGYNVTGELAVVGVSGAGNIVQGAGRTGFNVTGIGHQIVGCVVSGARKQGVRLTGSHHVLSGCVAERNHGDGIVGMGMDWRLAGNRAVDNANDGLVVSGTRVLDGGGNSGRDNGMHRRPHPGTQCTIGGVACVP